MKSEEVIEIWAKRLLVEDEIVFSDEDVIGVYEKEFYDGYCETCYYMWTRLVITVNGDDALVTGYDEMSEILNELLEIASEYFM